MKGLPITGKPEDTSHDCVSVEVIWAASTDVDGVAGVRFQTVQLSPPATVGKALLALGNQQLLDALSQGQLRAAVFGKICATERALQSGDRVELLGPVRVDPKEARARRAQVQRARKGDRRWGV